MDLLLSATKDSPALNVITGPVHSGKNRLLVAVTENLKEEHVPVLPINLRNASINSVNTLVSTLLEELDHGWNSSRSHACTLNWMRQLGDSMSASHWIKQLHSQLNNSMILQLFTKISATLYILAWAESPSVDH